MSAGGRSSNQNTCASAPHLTCELWKRPTRNCHDQFHIWKLPLINIAFRASEINILEFKIEILLSLMFISDQHPAME